MQPSRIAIDVMSGDYGPEVIIRGIKEARRLSPEPFVAYLCGDEKKVRETLDNAGLSAGEQGNGLIIEHCWETVAAYEPPSRVWKNKVNSSIIRCISLQQQGLAEASLSAGDTRILMGAALFILGRLKGVGRPALAAFLPTTRNRASLILDVGANLNCKVGHLVTFGKMGYSYVKNFFGINQPKVALLNIGKERTKGTRNISEADKEFKRWGGSYIGFIEGSGVLLGEADVIVCDGFVGNVLLKACESFHVLAETVVGTEGPLAEQIREKLSILNPENYGAVPLLGIKGSVLKAHGWSSSKAIANAILAALTAVKQRPFIL
jgi:glycerol-3-phosphate acyltransferase PlsX